MSDSLLVELTGFASFPPDTFDEEIFAIDSPDTQDGSDSLITSGDETLAILNSVNAGDLTGDSFITI